MPTHIAARILLIDHETVTYDAIRRIPGLAIDHVWTAAEAHELLSEVTYMFMVVDVALPGCNGAQLIRGLRNCHPETPLLVVTNEESVYVAADCMLAGVVDCLMKSAPPNAIRQRVEGMLGGTFPPPFNPLVVAAERIGHSIAGYQLERVLGYGAFGVVFEVCDKRTGKFYAMKVLRRPEDGRAPRIENLVPRFIQEGEVAMSIRHPNIVRALEYGLGGRPVVPFILYERVDGRPLHEEMAGRSRPLPVKVRMIGDLADALAALHAADVCHRDVKPENILLTRTGEAKLTDFGAVEDMSGTRQGFGVRGTIPYRAPEAFHATTVSDRSDVFSLGVVAYELWLGIHPFLRDDSESTARAVQYEEPLSPTAIQPSLPIPLATLLMRMLAKKPGQRPSASLVASEVLAFLQMSWR
ncbi:MAG TPA: hypothetical protein DCR55_13550 [Lentisphaeria bacterium]|nr:hypothetical protein [Lentisphaeria bacterium]